MRICRLSAWEIGRQFKSHPGTRTRGVFKGIAKKCEREYQVCLKRCVETRDDKNEMNREEAIKAVIWAISFPVALFLAHAGHPGALWLYVALVTGLAVVWILQGLFRKSD
jgi:hypothetical protein